MDFEGMDYGFKLRLPNLSNSMEEIEFLFLKNREEILNALNKAVETGNVIGICSPVLGSGIFLTAVEQIFAENDIFDVSETIVILKRYDMNGHFLDKNKLTLSDIKSVCPLKTEFKNPFLRIVSGG